MVISPSNHDVGRDETVTLTKTQLRAILQTLAKDNGNAPEEGILSLEREVSRQRHQSLPSLKAEPQLIEEDSPNCRDDNTVNQLSRLVPLPPIPSSANSEHSPRVGTPVASPSLQDLCHPASRSSTTTYTTSYNLSKVERKRLQWEREKAEMQEWNPWGKPGAGAPLRNNFYPPASSSRQLDVATEEEGLSVNGQTRSFQYRSPLHVARREDNEVGRWNMRPGHHQEEDPQAERRQRALQYQREIVEQVEEKRRRQREERERQMREEQQEEAKLAAERQRLQSEYDQEQERLRLKEEQKQKKQELLITAMKKAQASAEAARRVSRQKKKSPEKVAMPPPCSSSPSPPPASSMAEREEEEAPSVGSAPSLSPSPQPSRRECAVQAALAETCRCIHTYVENRVLTPSKLRMQSRLSCLHSRDMSTQTDSSLLGGSLSPYIRDDDSLTSEESSSESQLLDRVSRVQPFRQPRMASSLHPEQATSITPIQNGFRRRKLQELRKQHWEREMANQKLFVAADHLNGMDNLVDGDISQSPPSPLRDNPPSPPVPALQRKLLNSRLSAQPTEDRPQSPPVPALRRKLEASNTSFPQPSPPLRRQWSSSSENLPSAQHEHRCSIQGSTSSSSNSSAGSNPTMRRRWRSQETFLIPDNFPAESNVAVVAPSPQCRSASVGTRRRWDTEPHYSEDEGARKPATPDPLVHPEMVTGRPTPRQDRILQQLTDLRQGLMKKQKELESMIHPTPPS